MERAGAIAQSRGATNGDLTIQERRVPAVGISTIQGQNARTDLDDATARRILSDGAGNAKVYYLTVRLVNVDRAVSVFKGGRAAGESYLPIGGGGEERIVEREIRIDIEVHSRSNRLAGPRIITKRPTVQIDRGPARAKATRDADRGSAAGIQVDIAGKSTGAAQSQRAGRTVLVKRAVRTKSP